jgi:hypothetical protein
MVSSVPKNVGDLRFELLVQVLGAADEAHEAMPKPWLSSASLAAAMMSGWSARPR